MCLSFCSGSDFLASVSGPIRKAEAKLAAFKAAKKEAAKERKRVHSTAYVAARKAAEDAGKSEVALVSFSMRK